MTGPAKLWRARGCACDFRNDRRGASAVEFALVSGPFFVLILYILQIGLYYMTQAALDSGVIRAADDLRNSLSYAKTPLLPGAEDLKQKVATAAGGLVHNDDNLLVEIRPLADFTSGAVPITGGVASYGMTTSVLALRAQSTVYGIAPGFTSLTNSRLTTVTSTSLIRRQGR